MLHAYSTHQILRGQSALNTMRSPSEKTIVVFTLSYAPLVGGAEKQVQALSERWAAKGQSVWVVTRRVPGAPHRETINGVQVYRLFSIWFPGLSGLTLTLSLMMFLWPRRRQIGMLLVQMFNIGALATSWVSRLAGLPLVIKPSAGGPDGNLANLKKSFLGSFKCDFILDACTYIVAINQEVVHEYAAEGVLKRKIYLIPNGVDTDYFHAVDEMTRNRLREKQGLRPDLLQVLYVGRLEKVKNLDALIDCWGKLAAQFAQARLSIVGDGSERGHLEQLIAHAGLSSSISLLGPSDNPRELYQAADVFVLPSLREGISNALLEAMACGVPPVASQVGGNRDVIQPEVNGLLIDPLDSSSWLKSFQRLIQNKDLRMQLGHAARETVLQQYALDSVLSKYQALYSSLQAAYFRQPFPILAYHRVRSQPQYGIDLSTDAFDRQMRWLSRQGYRTLSLQEFSSLWKQESPFPKKSIVITFDDGHLDTFQLAFPILNKYGFKATLFVNSGLVGKRFWVGGRRPDPVIWHEQQPAMYQAHSENWRMYEFLSWDQIKSLQQAGWEIDSHAVTHPFLTQLTPQELEKELVESKRTLATRLGGPIDFFCYPSGDYNKKVQQQVASAGYQGAVVSPSHYELSYYWDDPYAWERIGLWQDVAFWKFKATVQGWYPSIYQRLPSWSWRIARKVYRAFRRS
jgi:glycosyltransferase involved in cell wall biosynthesis/peptidoglycan/xylan/chitin deacetylase (PgdA/CDA1 family)